MAFEIKQSLKLGQSLVMTPQLQQAIKLLQLNRLELQQVINQELVENPLLEEVMDTIESEENEETTLESQEAESPASEEPVAVQGEDRLVDGKEEFDWDEYIENFSSTPLSMPNTRELPDDLPNFENVISQTGDLSSHLEWQISLSSLTEKERELARQVVGNLDDDGYFIGSLEDISKELNFELEDAQEVLKMIQRFDPVGVASRDLRECLLTQVELLYKKKDPLMIEILQNHLNNLERRNYQAIAKATGKSIEEIHRVVKLILELEPKPGRAFASNADTQYITPDIYVYKVGDDFAIHLNEDGLPRLRISGYYRQLLMQAKREKGNGVTKDYIQDKLRSAVWLIKSIHNRQKTIFRVMESILKHQRAFFERGVEYLKPMVLRDVANDVGVHESTISRVTTNKYAHTPMGIFELKYFFNSGVTSSHDGDDVASESVKQKIKQLIHKEDPKRPLSDQKLVELLQDDGIDVARRTIAKYRESLGIISSARRKKMF